MMAKLGFKPGAALGATSNPNARTEPLEINVKEDKGGVGMLNEKKRKFREEVKGVEKRQRAEEGDYRERIGREREERRVGGLFGSAMRVVEGLEQPEGECVGNMVPLKKINILWRGLVKERRDQERERRMRYDLHQSLSRSAAYEDPEEDEDDRLALGKEEEDVDEEDDELNEFLSLEAKEKLQTLVEYLRDVHHYCFWCKYKYEDERMGGCPGFSEDDHY